MNALIPVSELAQLEEHIGQIHTAGDTAQLKTTLTHGIRWLGFDDLAMSVNKRDAPEFTRVPDICSREDSFIGIYQKRRMYERDPYVRECMSAIGPKWAVVDVNHEHPFVRELSEFFLTYNIHSAAFIPLPAKKGLFSGMIATGSQRNCTREDILKKFGILARAAMMKLELLKAPPYDHSDKSENFSLLTEQQIEILKWASEGKSNTSIAIITGLSKAGVDYHFRAIIAKLGVASRTQAVAMFARRQRKEL